MENINKAQLSAALKKALSSEHLWSRDAAKFLNLNPVYISMMLNPKTFDKCGATAWTRLNEWFLTNEPLSDFRIPDGEEIWQPKKQEPNIEGKGVETLPAGKKEKKEKKKKESLEKSKSEQPKQTNHIPDIEKMPEQSSDPRTCYNTKCFCWDIASNRCVKGCIKCDKRQLEQPDLLSIGFIDQNMGYVNQSKEVQAGKELYEQHLEQKEQPVAEQPAEINLYLEEKMIEAAADRIFLKLEKMCVDKGMIKETIAAVPVVSTENTTIRQSIALDIEINLIVNGQKVSIG